MAISWGGHLGTVADWDTRKSEIIWGQKAACRALPGTTLRGCQGCPLTSEVTRGHKAKDPPPQVLRRGRSGPKGPLTENSGREESAGFARIPPHAEVHLARERNSLERSKRGVGPFRASCQLQGLLWQPSAYWKGLSRCLLALPRTFA